MNAETTIQLSSGRMLDLLEPEPSSIFVEDIADALSKLCRFTGHTTSFYSVAQHCIHVSKLVPEHYALEGLMHDATEAFIGDLSTMLKAILGAPIKLLENNLHWAIAYRFGLRYPMPAPIKAADWVSLATERRDLMVPVDAEAWTIWNLPEPDATRLYPMAPHLARDAFLRRFEELS